MKVTSIYVCFFSATDSHTINNLHQDNAKNPLKNRKAHDAKGHFPLVSIGNTCGEQINKNISKLREK